MKESVPKSAQEALDKGWRMMCVNPVKLRPRNLIEILTPHFQQVEHTMFTANNRELLGRQSAVWVRGFISTERSQNLLLATLALGNPQTDNFAKSLLSEHMSGFDASKKYRINPHFRDQLENEMKIGSMKFDSLIRSRGLRSSANLSNPTDSSSVPTS